MQPRTGSGIWGYDLNKKAARGGPICFWIVDVYVFNCIMLYIHIYNIYVCIDLYIQYRMWWPWGKNCMRGLTKLLVFEGKTWEGHICHGGLVCCSAGEATYITWAFWSWTPLGQVAKYLGNPQTFEDEMRVSPSTVAFDLSMGWSSSSSKRISKLRARGPAFNREEMMKGQMGLVLYRVKWYDTGNGGWRWMMADFCQLYYRL